MALELTSPAFEQGREIPKKKYTCDGDDVSPPLRWRGAPDETRSFVLVCHDPDGAGRHVPPLGRLRHPRRPPRVEGGRGPCGGGGRRLQADGFRQAVDDFGRPGYGDPCPPEGHGPHHHHSRLMALVEPSLAVVCDAGGAEVEAIAERHVIGEVELVGVYRR